MIALKYSSETGVAPRYAHNGDACFDIEATDHHIIPPGDSATICTGLRFDIPIGYALMVYSRSGQGFVHGVRLGNCVGVIDSGYRGELRINLRNDGDATYEIKAGNRIAQAMLIQLPHVSMQLVDNIDTNTARSEGGFGSTGAEALS